MPISIKIEDDKVEDGTTYNKQHRAYQHLKHGRTSPPPSSFHFSHLHSSRPFPSPVYFSLLFLLLILQIRQFALGQLGSHSELSLSLSLLRVNNPVAEVYIHERIGSVQTVTGWFCFLLLDAWSLSLLLLLLWRRLYLRYPRWEDVRHQRGCTLYLPFLLLVSVAYMYPILRQGGGGAASGFKATWAWAREDR